MGPKVMMQFIKTSLRKDLIDTLIWKNVELVKQDHKTEKTKSEIILCLLKV